jgi:RNA polymerase sigma factor (sigma-70 family)
MSQSAGALDLYVTQGGRLRRLLGRLTGSAETAEDILHDAIVKLHGRSVGTDDIGLLVRTAQNLARDQLRAERVRRTYAEAVVHEQVAPGVSSPEDACAGRQELADLLDALKALPERTQRIFLLSRVDERSYPEIAQMLDVSVSTVEKDMISALDFCRTWRRRRNT